MPLQSKILANSFSVMSGSGWQPVSDGMSLLRVGWLASRGIHQSREHHGLELDKNVSG